MINEYHELLSRLKTIFKNNDSDIPAITLQKRQVYLSLKLKLVILEKSKTLKIRIHQERLEPETSRSRSLDLLVNK